MNQVPVGRSIAQAYGFLFGRILTVVSLSWVAAVFFGALRETMFALDPMTMPVIAQPLPALLHLATFLAALLLICAVAIPLTREALGDRGDWTLAHFVIGGREVRLFLALIRLYVVLIAVIVLCVLAVIGAAYGAKAALAQWPAAAQSGLPIEAIARGATIAIATIVALYVALRLSFFVYPVAAAEPHASLRRAWELGGGNVLRILAVVLAIAVPVYALVIAGEYALMGQRLFDTVHSFLTTVPRDMQPMHALFAAHAGAISLGAAVLMVVMAALTAGASASAYRRITGMDVDEQASADAVVAAPHDDHGHAEEVHVAEDHGHDEHGHAEEAHAAEDHGHAEHGHGEEAHAAEDHGHIEHGHGEETHGAEDHGHDDHGHAEHGHEEHGQGDHVQVHAAEDDVAHHDDGGGHDTPQAHGEEAHGEDHAAPAEDPHAHAALPENQPGPEGDEHVLTEADLAPQAGDDATHAAGDMRMLEHA